MSSYQYSGHLGTAIAINNESGATVAVLQPDGNLHPDYVDHPLTVQWIADVPDWEDTISALQPDELESPPNWESFRMAIATMPSYASWYNTINAANPALASMLSLAVVQENASVAQTMLNQSAAIAPPPSELIDLIALYSIPLEVS